MNDPAASCGELDTKRLKMQTIKYFCDILTNNLTRCKMKIVLGRCFIDYLILPERNVFIGDCSGTNRKANLVHGLLAF